MPEKPAHHRTPVVRITEIKPHSNADALEIIPVLGYQAVVRKGDFRIGDLAYYVFPDSVVPIRPEFEFLWKDRISDGEQPQTRHRRITAKKLRKEWSEGLLMPLERDTSVFGESFKLGEKYVQEGDDLSEILGVTHYAPPEPLESTRGDNEAGPKSIWPRSFKGWVFFLLRCIGIDVNGKTGGFAEQGPRYPVYDVEALKNFPNVFQAGDQVMVTEKIHGSSAKYVYESGWMGRGKFYVGSRNLWKSLRSSCVWRKVQFEHTWIEMWCRDNPGYALYGEVAPTQKGFDYGCKDGRTNFFVFDILDPSGKWIPIEEIFAPLNLRKFAEPIKHWVPILYCGPYDEAKIKPLVDGKSCVPGADNIREGVVIKSLTEGHRMRGLGRKQLKCISNQFFLKEG